MDECYRLPFELAPGRLIDLGANIGLTSLWFAHRYGCSTVIAVEPSPENARIARLNLERNNIKAEVIEAAVGAQDGTAQFEDHEDSNRGHVGSGGRVVSVVSMDTLLLARRDGLGQPTSNKGANHRISIFRRQVGILVGVHSVLRESLSLARSAFPVRTEWTTS